MYGKPKWEAHIFYKKKFIYIGTYDSEIDAALARDEIARAFVNEMPRLKLNFPDAHAD